MRAWVSFLRQRVRCRNRLWRRAARGRQRWQTCGQRLRSSNRSTVQWSARCSPASASVRPRGAQWYPRYFALHRPPTGCTSATEANAELGAATARPTLAIRIANEAPFRLPATGMTLQLLADADADADEPVAALWLPVSADGAAVDYGLHAASFDVDIGELPAGQVHRTAIAITPPMQRKVCIARVRLLLHVRCRHTPCLPFRCAPTDMASRLQWRAAGCMCADASEGCQRVSGCACMLRALCRHWSPLLPNPRHCIAPSRRSIDGSHIFRRLMCSWSLAAAAAMQWTVRLTVSLRSPGTGRLLRKHRTVPVGLVHQAHVHQLPPSDELVALASQRAVVCAADMRQLLRVRPLDALPVGAPFEFATDVRPPPCCAEPGFAQAS